MLSGQAARPRVQQLESPFQFISKWNSLSAGASGGLVGLWRGERFYFSV